MLYVFVDKTFFLILYVVSPSVVFAVHIFL